MQWIESSAASKHPTMHRIASPMKNDLAQNVDKGQVEQLWSEAKAQGRMLTTKWQAAL